MDATFGSFLLSEQVESNLPQNCWVFGSLIFAGPAVVFLQGDVHDPVQLVSDGPVFANRMQHLE
jgi:hypothetical protein